MFKTIIYTSPQKKEQKISLTLSTFVPLTEKSTSIIIVPKNETIEKISTILPPLIKKKYYYVKEKKIKKKIKQKSIKKPRKTKKFEDSKDPLANILMNAGKPRYINKSSQSSSSYSEKIIKYLYGKEFNTYSSSQKKFIRNNLKIIHQITQRTLSINGYPDTAVRTKQQGSNIVSFYLHPNGDITGLKLKKRIGYATLDHNTLKVIRIAYKDYPLPSKKTKIIFYVKYSIY